MCELKYKLYTIIRVLLEIENKPRVVSGEQRSEGLSN